MGLIQQNSIFGPGARYFKFYKESLAAVDAANLIAKLDLCNVKIKFDQYYRTRITIPKAATNFNLNLSNLTGSNNFIFMLATYNTKVADNDKYLIWTLEGDTVDKNMAEALLLTSTADKPLPQVIITNPDQDNAVTLEVMASALDFESSDTADTAYDTLLYNISLAGVRTLVVGQSIAIYNDDNAILMSINLTNINNLSINDKIVEIDDTAQGLIGIQMDSVAYARQLFSALNWLLGDTATRTLPVSLDITPPDITVTSNVILNTVTPDIDISVDYPTGFIASDAITLCIDMVEDTRDGLMAPSSLIVEMTQGTMVYSTILNPGTYNLKFKAKDLAGNETVLNITVTFI